MRKNNPLHNVRTGSNPVTDNIFLVSVSEWSKEVDLSNVFLYRNLNVCI